jgi:hypothetical protein
MQRKHDKCRAVFSPRIQKIPSKTCLRLRRRIQKIYEMSTAVVEGYGKFYEEQHNKPLSQETIDKIMLLYHNCIERCCREVGLTVEEEEQWDAKDASIDENELSDSREESEEHDSDDVNFYTDSEEYNKDEEREFKKDDKQEGDDEKGQKAELDREDDSNGDVHAIEKLEHEIKTLRANLDNDLVILQRMTSSPNHKNPCGKYDEWSALKRNDVEEKVAVIKAKINDLKSKGSSTKDRRKGKRGK